MEIGTSVYHGRIRIPTRYPESIQFRNRDFGKFQRINRKSKEQEDF